ncbi:MAG: hypothetical protein K0S76_455 [Herbinix sp.]|jgi:hypothetical protein|nr:hypothetical protein [Herbinix sp.]
MQIDVIAVHNTIGDVKPLWILRDGKKYKIDKINTVTKLRGLTVYHCVIDGEFVSLQFNGVRWWVD